MIHRVIHQAPIAQDANDPTTGGEPAFDGPPLAAGPTLAIAASATREELVAALDREIIRGLEAGDLVIPTSRRNDHAWLTRNARINNRNARGQAVHALAVRLFKMDVRASLSRE
jgi:hypothetical protein